MGVNLKFKGEHVLDPDVVYGRSNNEGSQFLRQDFMVEGSGLYYGT